MKIEMFDKSWFGNLWTPDKEMGKFGGGQVTIIGGSELFHGAPGLTKGGTGREFSENKWFNV